MSFKIDTKEKFTVITPKTVTLDANIAETLWEAATKHRNEQKDNIVVNLINIFSGEAAGIAALSSLQQHINAHKKSFVVCHVQPPILELIKNEDLEDHINITPTESEAWDLVQMEEIERELMDDFKDEKGEFNG